MSSKALSSAVTISSSTTQQIQKPRVYMISGHIDLSWNLFLSKYAELIERAIHGYLPPDFEPQLPNHANENQTTTKPLPPFDINKFCPFLASPSTSAIFQQNPDYRVPHTITATINSIPPLAELSSPSTIFSPPLFVMGDAEGTDFFSQVYLIGRGFKDFITVYHRGNQPRALASKSLKCIGEFSDHTKKDAAMTMASDIDLAWIRTTDEQRALYGAEFRPRISGTEKNILRRREKNAMQMQTVVEGAESVSKNSSNRRSGKTRLQ
jgi:hypothetical protein